MTMSALKQPLQACVGERSNDLHSKARVSLLREELATLTKNHEHAIVLSQLLYWTQRTKDFHLMLEEEKKNSEVRNNSPRYGWIYKTANDLIADTKLYVDRTSIRRYLRCLITKEWIQTRANPQSKWNRTIQYRVNVKKIQHDLIALGHHLSELSLWGLEDILLREDLETAENCNGHFAPSSGHNVLSSDHNTPSEEQHLPETAENCNGHFAPSNGHNALSSDHNTPSEEQVPSEMTENSNGQNAHSNGHDPLSSDHMAPSEEQHPSEMAENSNGHFAHSSGHNALSSDYIAPSEEQHPPKMAENSNGQNARSNTESTTENKTELTKKEHRAGRTSAGHAGTGAYACEEELDGSDREVAPPSAKVAALMVDLWRRHVNPEAISLTDERKRRLESLLSLHFQADLRLWEAFCLRVKAAPFLMGEGKRKWQITLDWIFAKDNLLKVLEGRFDDSERIEHQKNEQFKGVSDRETRALLDSIQDPLWKNWCSQLLGIDPITGGPLLSGGQPLKAVLTVSELKEITQARFMEFDERLVWIECFDQKTLNKIEDLRFKFSPIAQATFPKARAVRGYLNLSFNQPQFTQQKGHNAPSEEQCPLETAENSNGHFAPSNGHNALSGDHMASSEEQCPSETAENSNGHFAPSNGHNALSSGHMAPSEGQYPSKMAENSNGQNALSNGQNAHSKGQNARSNTESTTKNKTEITKKEHRAGRTSAGAYACEEELDGSDREATPPSAKVAALMVDLWRRHVNPEAIFLTDERKRRLESLLLLHFQADLQLWEAFCLRVKAAPFLMGEGKRKWQITLDWILAKGNFLRVLDGNFDDSERIDHQKNEQFKGVQDRETRSLLDSITDSLWKNWCSQLMGIHPLTGVPLMDGDQPIKAVLTVSELKEITQARFMEFDERLVWIECFDQKTLNKIEDLRLKFSSIAQATFPKARAVRGHLNLGFNQSQFTQQKGHNAPSEEQCPLEMAENSNGHFAHSNGHNILPSDHMAPSEEQHPSEMAENSNGQNALSNGQNAPSNGQNARSNTESTTKNKTEITKKEHRAGRTGTGAYACEEELDGSDREQEATPLSAKVAALMVDLWRRHVNPETISLTDERKRRLESLFSLHFQADLRLWESFCLRVKAAPFLMGEGKRKWQVTLDWALAKGNFLKVLEGNFDDLDRIEHQKNEQFKGVQDRETCALLDSITDPLWKNWCSQLLGIDPITGGPLLGGGQPLKAVLTVSELKEITQARFMEFDERLIWIECFDQKTLNKVEDLRFKFSPIAQTTFPKARAVRGYLNLSFNQPQTTQQKGENYAE